MPPFFGKSAMDSDISFKPKSQQQFSLRKSLSKSVDSFSKFIGGFGGHQKSKRKEEKGLDKNVVTKMRTLLPDVKPVDVPLGILL